ncbi:unnamed protein product [Prorocentrum cordatum]|uniref:Uncharacterized protein n=1 Tax=Prorocentrum cordatum TaxID=2364126 RepID=A0ABN9WGG2_9DINO|nr:unnamed protein product [Polarella glacialis]
MGNGVPGLCVHEDNEPVTNEKLQKAVRRMDSHEVARCLDAGIGVNDPVDAQGHTVLDIFVVEHAKHLQDSLNFRGRPEEATRLLFASQEAAAEVLHVLRHHGAMLSGPQGVKTVRH